LWAQGREEAPVPLEHLCDELAMAYDIDVKGLCVINNA
jgi:hypothetical protein